MDTDMVREVHQLTNLIAFLMIGWIVNDQLMLVLGIGIVTTLALHEDAGAVRLATEVMEDMMDQECTVVEVVGDLTRLDVQTMVASLEAAIVEVIILH